ncbi:MAG TPA: hypothetical protein VIB99_09005, partial [Candidatus Limnocylindrales bacterium]
MPVQPGTIGRQALHRLLAADPRLEPLFPTVLLELQISAGEAIDIGWLLSAWLGRASVPARPGGGPAGYPWPLALNPETSRPEYIGA